MRLGGRLPERLFVASQIPPLDLPALHPRERLSRLDGPAFRVAIGQLGGLQDAFPDQLWPMVEMAMRADCQLTESFEGASDVIPVPITALVGTDDGEMCLDDVQGWRALSTAEFSALAVPGGHFLSRSSAAELIGVLGAVTRPPDPASPPE